MKPQCAVVLLFATLACAPKVAPEPCGVPSEIWAHSDDFVYPHHAIINKINVTHLNQIIVNGVPREEIEVRKFLADLGSTPTDFLMFDFDAHADCDQVRIIRKIIESSKFCSQKNCFYGDADIEPPAFKLQEREPS